MKVSLVSYTKPAGILENTEVKTPTDLVAYCARVSNPTNQMNSVTSEKLIKYLIKHKHWSPLEMVDVTMEVETTRDIARQMLRHRSFSFQEFSQRYADVSSFGEMFELGDARLQDPKNRQNSVDAEDEELQIWWRAKQAEIVGLCTAVYRDALDRGIAKEVARKILPEGLTKSRMYMKGSLRSWIHYLEVRGEGSGTQKEHVEVAKQIAKAIVELFPVASEFQHEISKSV
jgi:thymidylate synthase (FAD)